MSKTKVEWKVIKPNTPSKDRERKRFRVLGPRFENAGQALCRLIYCISELPRWSEIHIKLIKEE